MHALGSTLSSKGVCIIILCVSKKDHIHTKLLASMHVCVRYNMITCTYTIWSLAHTRQLIISCHSFKLNWRQNYILHPNSLPNFWTSYMEFWRLYNVIMIPKASSTECLPIHTTPARASPPWLSSTNRTILTLDGELNKLWNHSHEPLSGPPKDRDDKVIPYFNDTEKDFSIVVDDKWLLSFLMTNGFSTTRDLG